MASSYSACVGRPSVVNFTPDATPSLQHHKLDRLRELRAVIDTLRDERETHDPLLAWIADREKTENHRRD